MTISDIYQKYHIIPSLQLHMLRVAAVVKIISNNINQPTDTSSMITACLLHDMGNILKFDLQLFPEFLAPQGQAYWQMVKDEFLQKYGSDEHQATITIAHELGVNQRVIELIEAVGFTHAKDNFLSEDLAKKIVIYADMRVHPKGVVSLEARLQDGHRRFQLQKSKEEREDYFQEMAGYLKKIEQQIFEHCRLKPEDITDKKILVFIDELRSFNKARD